MQKVKICGLTDPREAIWLVEEKADYAGVVVFFPKSKRNNTLEQAADILAVLSQAQRDGASIQTVAVTVSPSVEQIQSIEKLGFDHIQIHGKVTEDIFSDSKISIIRAIHDEADWKQLLFWTEQAEWNNRLHAVLFDAKEPGSGETFDWSCLQDMEELSELRNEKQLFLAGGLTIENVGRAVRMTHPDVVDVSSGVEFSKEQVGKDREKITAFIKAAREA